MTDAQAARRPGAILLARHGKPALSRKVRLSAEEYRAWWARYEVGGLQADQTPPEDLRAAARAAGAVVASTRRRSVESALAAAAGREFLQDPDLIEAPLPPPRWPSVIRMSPILWGFFARVWWWFFNIHGGEESRAEAERRAEAVASRLLALAANGEDVLVLAHGFFNTMVGRALTARGWRCVEDGGYRYWAVRRFEAPGGARAGASALPPDANLG
jgi:broad specificity phosphatase PhoE